LIDLNFVFSQSNLETFRYCRKRFFLRYLKQLVWPAQPFASDEYQQDRQAGIRLHKLIHRHFLGFDRQILLNLAQNDDDQRIFIWMQTFLDSPYADLDGKLFPEKTYITNQAGFRLSAKPDLLKIDANGRITIFDWKSSRRMPRRQALLESLQSKVYPLVIRGRFGANRKPPEIRMVYWEANFPNQITEFYFGEEDHQKALGELTALVEAIRNCQPEDFTLTEDVRRCAWCEYRSYCGRAAAPGGENLFDITEMPNDEIKIPESETQPWE